MGKINGFTIAALALAGVTIAVLLWNPPPKPLDFYGITGGALACWDRGFNPAPRYEGGVLVGVECV